MADTPRNLRDVPGPEYPAGTGAGMAREREKTPLEMERSTSQIVTQIMDHAQEIIRSEVRLARVEIREEVSKAAKASGMMIAGGVVALYGIGFLIACVVWAIALAVPAWAAALAIGGLLTIIGGGMFSAGRNGMKKVNPVPEQTIQSIKEDAEWLKRRAG